jgi:hypothetical protein
MPPTLAKVTQRHRKSRLFNRGKKCCGVTVAVTVPNPAGFFHARAGMMSGMRQLTVLNFLFAVSLTLLLAGLGNVLIVGAVGELNLQGPLALVLLPIGPAIGWLVFEIFDFECPSHLGTFIGAIIQVAAFLMMPSVSC